MGGIEIEAQKLINFARERQIFKIQSAAFAESDPLLPQGCVLNVLAVTKTLNVFPILCLNSFLWSNISGFQKTIFII